MACKSDLIEHIKKTENITKADAERYVKATLGALKHFLNKKEKVLLVDFGTFFVKHVPSMERANPLAHLNPKAPKKVVSKAKDVVKFRAGAAMQKLVNKTATTTASKKK